MYTLGKYIYSILLFYLYTCEIIINIFFSIFEVIMNIE